MDRKKYRILLSNDDGVEAPGINALYKALSRMAELTIVAPLKERSATAHAISIFDDVLLYKVYKNSRLWAYALDGTPADCVKLALTTLMKKRPPHLVISGINRGQNTGTSVLYSGTVAAAIEAAMYGYPALAVSVAAARTGQVDFSLAGKLVARLLPQLIKKGLPTGVVLNINIPNVPVSDIKGVVISRQGQSMYVDYFKKQRDINGAIIYKNIGEEMIPSHSKDVDIDDVALSNNMISITPLQYDLTHHELRGELGWIKDILSD